jgi:oligosaccharide amylase
MARATTVGNGNLLVGLDQRGHICDLYYPFVGESNHVSGASGSHFHRIGIWVDDVLTWLTDSAWTFSQEVDILGHAETICATHEALQIRFSSRSIVHNERDVFLREFTIESLSTKKREVKLFLSQQFRISESRRGDTGYYDPKTGSIIHYKGNVTLLINSFYGNQQFSEFNIGLFGIEGKEGTWHDAFDGRLEGNAIEHGSVDSIIAHTIQLAPKKIEKVDYWIVAAPSVSAARELNEEITQESAARLIASTGSYWEAWLEKEARNLSMLPPDVQRLYRKSLLVMRMHADNRGGIIASSDTDMLHHGRDCYSYVWPRDAALIAHAFDQAGYQDAARRCYDFFSRCQEPEGYLMHKYRSDGALGSSWHPWVKDGKEILPIQEDETATVLFALFKHYQLYKDLEYIESIYNSFIEPAAYFLVSYIEPTTGLPQASFDLWEEKYGTSTYTAASVCAALSAAAFFAVTLGKDADARSFEAAASRMRKSISEHLYDATLGYFVKQIIIDDEDEVQVDATLDVSSLHGLLFFDILDITDEKITNTIKAIEERLYVHNNSKGYVRYDGDNYYRLQDAGSPNPWVICTLWVARYYIARAELAADLEHAHSLLEWTSNHANSGGLLAEQMRPDTRDHLSASPLVWSHAEFVLTILAYIEKYKMLHRQ